MGLAYDLNTQSFPNWFISEWDLVLRQGDFNLFRSLETGGRGDDISIPSAYDANYSEFDVVIRNTTYVRDFYVVCGSYRAFFQELNGGAGAWAWDGFVTLIRAHNVSQRGQEEAFYYENFDPSQLSKPTNFWLQPPIVDFGWVVSQPFDSYENAFFTYLCRMPYEVEPDLTGLGSDKTPGVYAVDVVSDGDSGRIKIMAAGHQRIASSEGMLSSQNYSAWISQIDFVADPTIVVRNFGSSDPGGKSTERPFTVAYSNTGFQVSWKADQANHVGRYLPNSKQYPSTVYALEDLAHSINTTTPITAIPNFVNLTTLSNGFYLSRIHDVVVINGGPFPLSFASSDSTGITICITGEAIADDGAGGVDFTTPSLGFWQPNNAGTPTYNQLYTALGSENFGLDSSVSYDLDGSYGTIIMPTFSESPDPVLTNLAVGLDRVTYGATTSTAIYATNFEIALGAFPHPAPNKPDPDQVICPFAIKGGGFETATGFSMPDKWYGKAVQQATYSRTDEATAKNASVYPEITNPDDGIQTLTAYPDQNLKLLLETDPTLGVLEPDPLNFLASVYPENRYAYGIGNTPYVGPGLPANVAYGFLGYTAGVGPVIFMYDFGTLLIQATNTSPVRFEMSDGITPVSWDVISVGSSINAAIQTAGTATARRPVSARWDADRDQWIFTFADDVSGSLVSCNSAFNRQPANQVAYLDQTDQFTGLDSDQRSSLYISRNMTPFLDGLVLFGGSLDTTSLGQATLNSILIPPNNPSGGPSQVRGFQSFIINGTTGRSADVWVDYLLFDGVDSLIAVELQNIGLRVTVENVEWYKAKIIRQGKLGITPEEIEDWVRSQQTEYRETLKLKERQGRLRTRRRQQAAWREGLEDTLSGDFQETTGFDSLESLDRASETFVPSASESAPKSGDKSKKHSSIQKSNSDKKQNRDS